MAEREYVTVTNVSNQMIPIQVRSPAGDFYLEERQARINPGRSIQLPRNFLNQGQLENLKSRHHVQIATN